MDDPEPVEHLAKIPLRSRNVGNGIEAVRYAKIARGALHQLPCHKPGIARNWHSLCHSQVLLNCQPPEASGHA